MQFMPATFAAMGVDGDGDGRADIHNDADSVFSAANYLTQSGVSHGAAGVRRALFAYNHVDLVRQRRPLLRPPLRRRHRPRRPERLRRRTATATRTCHPSPTTGSRPSWRWARRHVGGPYRMGANGPAPTTAPASPRPPTPRSASGMPRTAAAQRSWLAAGNGTRIRPGHERPGDLVFWDSYLGPNTIGHVMIVDDPAASGPSKRTAPAAGIGYFSYADGPQPPHLRNLARRQPRPEPMTTAPARPYDSAPSPPDHGGTDLKDPVQAGRSRSTTSAQAFDALMAAQDGKALSVGQPRGPRRLG